MKFIHHYEGCISLTLFRWGSRNVEIWFCPANYKIIEHKHPNEDIELMFIYGDAEFARRKNIEDVSEVFKASFPRHLFKLFSVKAGHYHYFTVSKRPLIFINFSRWLNNTKPTSAADDFEVVKVQV